MQQFQFVDRPDFNPRSREGSDQISWHLLNKRLDFNPRSREGSDITDPGNRFCQGLFQSTLPRRERLMDNRTFNTTEDISIHAPAKGATVSTNPIYYNESNFNPRSREGSDSAKLHRLWLKLINTRELLFPKIQFCH